MTPEEHLALAQAEYTEADRQTQRQMYSTPEQRLLAAQTEALLAIAEHLLTRKPWWRRLRP